jgi:Putative lumazine-binding
VALEQIAALYAIEADIRGQAPAERAGHRQVRAAPLLESLRRALHATAVGDAPLFTTMDHYFVVVEKRDPPARRGDIRKERIISIELFGPVTALVKLECEFFSKDFIDMLSLIKADGSWQIIAKVFHYDLVG